MRGGVAGGGGGGDDEGVDEIRYLLCHTVEATAAKQPAQRKIHMRLVRGRKDGR